MATFGVTSTGFVLKRQEDIEAEMIADLSAAFGQIDTDADSTFGQILGVESHQLAQLWEQGQSIYNSEYPSTAEGVSLDNSASIVALTRLAATPSTAVVQMLGTEGTVIPSGTSFSQAITDYTFNSISPATISATTCQQTDITVTPVGSAVYTVTINGTPVAVTAPSGSPTADAICTLLKSAILADLTVGPLLTVTHVAGTSAITILSEATATTSTLAVSVGANLAISNIWSPVSVRCTVSAAYSVPSKSITAIATPVSGMSAVTNLTEGTTGKNLETDAAFRIRRRNSLNITGAGTLGSIVAQILQTIPAVTNCFIFENSTGDTDSSGRPGHSFEIIVAAPNTGPNNAAVAKKIWERKPGGIATHGNTSVSVLDLNGATQAVNFSFAVPKYAWIKLTCHYSGSSEILPVNAEAIIKQGVMDLGSAMNFGQDLLYQKFANCGFAAGGIETVTAQMAVTVNPGDTPSYTYTNIPIDPINYASFDPSRITVIFVP